MEKPTRNCSGVKTTKDLDTINMWEGEAPAEPKIGATGALPSLTT